MLKCPASDFASSRAMKAASKRHGGIEVIWGPFGDWLEKQLFGRLARLKRESQNRWLIMRGYFPETKFSLNGEELKCLQFC